jgi:uncharacterized membrane protein
VGIFILLAGWILTIIGYVGLLILGLKLNDLEKNPLYLVAGILFIVGIFVPILGFIAWDTAVRGVGREHQEGRGDAGGTDVANSPQPLISHGSYV